MALDSSHAAAPASGAAAQRSLQLLALLAASGRALSLAELSARLALPKATVHRLCMQLQASGFVARDVDERSFGVGHALHRLAFDALTHGTVRALRHEVLAALVAQVGETCNFTTLDGARVLYLDRVEAHWPLRLTLEVGSHVPLHCTASGKLLLAHLPKAQRDLLLARLPLEPNTPNTLNSPDALRSECELIAAQGHACDNEEFITGLIAVAVPVRDAAGQVRAALAVHAPTARMTLRAALERVPAMHEAARSMSGLL